MKELSDRDKTILTGRIYPVIQSCIGNRYKIIIGYFAVVGFILATDERLEKIIDSGAVAFIAVIFSLFVIHNSINHWRNIKEQQKLERNEEILPVVDLLFGFVMFLLIWGGYWFLKSSTAYF